MVSPQFHISHNDFFETVCPASRNPPIYSNWQALPGLIKHEHPVKGLKDVAAQWAERSNAFITQEVQNPPANNREKEGLPM